MPSLATIRKTQGRIKSQAQNVTWPQQTQEGYSFFPPTMSQAKILVVDDEKPILETVQYNLEKAGFRVVTAQDGEAAIDRCRQEEPDLIVLDLMLPKKDGLEVCRTLRQDAKLRRIPILILSVKADETDKVVGLELGADDYLTKPFSPRELIARVRAILRRGAEQTPSETFELDGLRVDWGKHLVTVGGKPADLTAKEFGLLRALIEARGRVLSREILLDRVWGYDRSLEIETRTVDLHVSQLRRKLRASGACILTVKGSGYRFRVDE